MTPPVITFEYMAYGKKRTGKSIMVLDPHVLDDGSFSYVIDLSPFDLEGMAHIKVTTSPSQSG